MSHPVDRGHRRQQFLDRRKVRGTRRWKSDDCPFLHRFTQEARSNRELAAMLAEAR